MQEVSLVDRDRDDDNEEDDPVEQRYGGGADVAHDRELGHDLQAVDHVHIRAVPGVESVHLELGERLGRVKDSADVADQAPPLDNARDHEQVDHHAVHKHETAQDVPVAVEREGRVGHKRPNGRDRRHHLEHDELEHLRHLLLRDGDVPHQGDFDDRDHDEDDEISRDQDGGAKKVYECVCRVVVLRLQHLGLDVCGEADDGRPR
mmetsp:Transcript_28268/g.84366  ORF Transcript_28268/g.84366 Transcript_28268/m.84366 type:complete len:205 (+) Transcript_28268:685-1299(+)